MRYVLFGILGLILFVGCVSQTGNYSTTILQNNTGCHFRVGTQNLNYSLVSEAAFDYVLMDASSNMSLGFREGDKEKMVYISAFAGGNNQTSYSEQLDLTPGLYWISVFDNTKDIDVKSNYKFECS